MRPGLYSHLPYREIPWWSDEAQKHPRLCGFEIYISGYRICKLEEKDISDLKKAAEGFKTTIHAPWEEINLGSDDPHFTEIYARRLNAALDIAEHLGSLAVVLHTGYLFEKVQVPEMEKRWLENARRFLAGVLEKRQGAHILIENVFERDPDTFRRIFDGLCEVHPLSICFDTGHAHFLSHAPLSVWLDTLGTDIIEVHLHDNAGDCDAHLPPGDGTIDFPALFEKMATLIPSPRIVLEMHKKNQIIKGLDLADGLVKRYYE